ncbi:hypothetical protein AGMMS49938_07250 [Fibrobacterales bacterium]|nr:hypothetical protein AGMMS49938_07250 [Fibrobacterales bacterium]
MQRIAIINRAVPGSGKSVFSACIANAAKENNLSAGIHSTDDFFMKNGEYIFELDKLSGFHAKNLVNFTNDLREKKSIVICDNTNLLPWQSEPYTTTAREFGYRIILLNLYPRKLEEHIKDNIHQLPQETLSHFIDNFNKFNDLTDKNKPRNQQLHHAFKWSEEQHCSVDTGKLANYFDFDYKIEIAPSDFVERQKTIWNEVLQIMQEKSQAYSKFDVLFHLVGKERFSLFAALKNFRAKKHIFVETKECNADNLLPFIPNEEEYERILTRPYSIEETKRVIEKKLKKLNENGNLRIAFNIKNGTKIMCLSAYEVSQKIQGTAVYFEEKANRFIYLNKHESKNFHGFSDIEELFRIKGFSFEVSNRDGEIYKAVGKWKPVQEQRKNLTKEMLNAKIEKTCGQAGEQAKSFAKLPTGEIIEDFRYITGGWLEEFVYIVLERLLNEGKIRDLRIGLKIAEPKKFVPFQEFDVVFTDGRFLYFIECKSGKLSIEDVQKHHDNILTYGGIYGRGFLVTKNSADNYLHREDENMQIICAKDFADFVKNKLEPNLWQAEF